VAAGRALHSEDTSADQDGALGRLATRILAEEIAPYAAGHGGSIVLVDVRDGTVDVELAGACHGCPAAAFTIQGRLEHRMRAEAPWLVGVRVAEHRGRS
jgi:Fe-S cluster biogenesis protein NfuA